MQFERIDEMSLHGRTGTLPETLTVEQLTEVFGEPVDVRITSNGKSRYEWRMRFEDGTLAAIWDYYDIWWSVGGSGAEQTVRKAIEEKLRITL